VGGLYPNACGAKWQTLQEKEKADRWLCLRGVSVSRCVGKMGDGWFCVCTRDVDEDGSWGA